MTVLVTKRGGRCISMKGLLRECLPHPHLCKQFWGPERPSDPSTRHSRTPLLWQVMSLSPEPKPSRQFLTNKMLSLQSARQAADPRQRGLQLNRTTRWPATPASWQRSPPAGARCPLTSQGAHCLKTVELPEMQYLKNDTTYGYRKQKAMKCWEGVGLDTMGRREYPSVLEQWNSLESVVSEND